MKLKNIDSLYELDYDRRLLSKIIDALKREGDEPYVIIKTTGEEWMRLPTESAKKLRSMLKNELIEVEQKILEL